MKQYFNVINAVIDFTKFYADYSILQFLWDEHIHADKLRHVEACCRGKAVQGSSRGYACYALVKKENEKSAAADLGSVEKCGIGRGMKTVIVRLMVNLMGTGGPYYKIVHSEKNPDKKVCLFPEISDTDEGILICMKVITFTHNDGGKERTVYKEERGRGGGKFMVSAIPGISASTAEWYMHSYGDGKSQVDALSLREKIEAKSSWIWRLVSNIRDLYGRYLPCFEFAAMDVERYTPARCRFDMCEMLCRYFEENDCLAIGGETDELKSEIIRQAGIIGIKNYTVCEGSDLLPGKSNLYGLSKGKGGDDDTSAPVYAQHKITGEITQHITRQHLFGQHKDGKYVELVICLKECMMMHELSVRVIHKDWGWTCGMQYEFFMPVKNFDGQLFRYMKVVDGNIAVLENVDRHRLFELDAITADHIGARNEYSVRMTDSSGTSTTVIIKRTEKVAIADMDLLWSEFNKEKRGNDIDISVGDLCGYMRDAYDHIVLSDPKKTDFCRRIMDCFLPVFTDMDPARILKWSDIKKKMKVAGEKNGVTGYAASSFKRELFDLISCKLDDVSYTMSRGREMIDRVFPSMVDITYTDSGYFSAVNSTLYGVSNNIQRWEICRYSHFYETQVYGDRSFLTEIYRMLSAMYIRYNATTVIPFPFAYLRRACEMGLLQ